ncbi:MAG TPA: nucleotide-diphospho-sugar transferase [Polyangia bacterium]|jgi:hypothetical protein
MIICSYEDRPSDVVGLKLLVCSVQRHLPDIAVHIGCPGAPAAFARWMAGRTNVTLEQIVDPTLKGWNAKPVLLLRLLEAGHDSVTWMDSDLIVAGDFRAPLKDDQALVLTNELAWKPHEEALMRTRGWNLPLGHRSSGLVNSAFLRVGQQHRPLLQEWIRLLKTPAYQVAQTLPFHTRPPHMIGDQDVLSALLGSAAFCELPVTILSRGLDIIHDIQGGYHPWDRLANLARPMPPLVHAQSYKPWRFLVPPSPLREPTRYYHLIHVETSPYGHVARQYSDELDDEAPWLNVRSLPGKLANAMALGNPHLPGLPQALVGRLRDRQIRARHQLTRVGRAARRLMSRMNLVADQTTVERAAGVNEEIQVR